MIIKRVFDIIVSFLGLIILSPILILIIFLIKINSSGPVFFRQERAGKNKTIFNIWKFRTMYSNTDPYGDSPNFDTDMRITTVGRFLREYSLDEIPQLLNVLKGNMSLVGPRPIYLELADKLNTDQAKRFIMQPGITGLAQIQGRTKLTWKQRIEFDCFYVENWSFIKDIIILFRTIYVLLFKKNIYEIEASLDQHGIGEKGKS